MNAEGDPPNSDVQASSDVDRLRTELENLNPSIKRRILEKFALAALGSIPWVGGFISALASVKAEEAGLQTDNLQTQWLEEHQCKMETLGATMQDIGRRFEAIGDEINDRLASEEYLDTIIPCMTLVLTRLLIANRLAPTSSYALRPSRLQTRKTLRGNLV